MKLYLYCVAKSVANVEGLPHGLEEQEVELVMIEDLAVVVSKFSGDAATVNREDVLRHDAVIRGVFAETTPLPFRFGTLATENSLKSYIATRREALVSRLEAVQQTVEMNVKVIWKKLGDSSSSEETPTELGPGASFLLQKQREIRGAEKVKVEANDIAAWLDKLLSGMCKDSRVNVDPAQKLVYSGAYLLHHAAASEFRETLNTAKGERPDLHFLVSGPWPPYTFADIDLEFKSQFGVS